MVLDTNVLVSALISTGLPNKVVFDCVIGRNIPICLSQAILDEYENVLMRPKFAKFSNFRTNAKRLLPKLVRVAEFYEPVIKLDFIKDESDNRFLELAVSAKANFIITGNTNDFTFPEYEGIQIVSPKFFYENYCQ